MVAEAILAQQWGKVLLALVVKPQLVPTKGKVAPPDLATVVAQVVAVVVTAVATAAQYPAAIKVAMLEHKAAVQELVKIRLAVLLVAL